MTGRTFGLDEQSFARAQAALVLARNLGLIDDSSLTALDERRKRRNADNARKEAAGEMFYGPHSYTPAMYLQYELTRFRLDFVQPVEQIRKLGVCPGFSESEKRTFYEKNLDLFSRYHGDLFAYEDVAQIIEKRLREEVYDKLIEDILRQFDSRK